MGDDVSGPEVAPRSDSTGADFGRDPIFELTSGAGRQQGVGESSGFPTLIGLDGLPLSRPIEIFVRIFSHVYGEIKTNEKY